MTERGLADTFAALLRPGMTVALGDGAGAVGYLDDGESVGAALSEAAGRVGSVRLVLGWLPQAVKGLAAEAFSEVVALMPGAGARRMLQLPNTRSIPARLTAWPALLAGPLRPDVLITRLAEHRGGYRFGSEVSFQQGLVDQGTRVLGIVDRNAPDSCAESALPHSLIRIVGHTAEGPAHHHREPDPVHSKLADAVLQFIPPHARVQYGPGPLGTALLRNATVPLQIDTGLLTNAVVDLDRHGLLLGTPSATYLVGTDTLYSWADCRPVLRSPAYTHDLTRLSRGKPFFAVNTAIEIDVLGQVNVEGIGSKVVGGIGGHPDFCAAARMHPEGLSIIAVPQKLHGRSPLVDRLSRAASTPAADIDVIVTESGHVDLRAADWTQRASLISELFGQ